MHFTWVLIQSWELTGIILIVACIFSLLFYMFALRTIAVSQYYKTLMLQYFAS